MSGFLKSTETKQLDFNRPLKQLRFGIVGQGELLPLVAAELQARNFTIVWVSRDPIIDNYQITSEIPLFPLSSVLQPEFSSPAVDVLLSIDTPAILPSELLHSVKYALHFHPTRLPRYCGWYAYSWPLLQRERVHGACWQLITPGSPANHGPIVASAPTFGVSSDETAQTLSEKCTRHG